MELDIQDALRQFVESVTLLTEAAQASAPPPPARTVLDIVSEPAEARTAIQGDLGKAFSCSGR